MIFYFVMHRSKVPDSAVNAVYLIYDNWDDYGFRTTFGVTVFDENGLQHDLPRFNIGFRGQTTSDDTYTLLKESFNELPKEFFSLCGSVDFYKSFIKIFPRSGVSSFWGHSMIWCATQSC